LFKLLGTGVFAGLVAAGSSDPIVVKTCGLAAAINAVAVLHYVFSAPLPLRALLPSHRC
jgi:sulfopyruvate decarboxylase TPP-binding subunit